MFFTLYKKTIKTKTCALDLIVKVSQIIYRHLVQETLLYKNI